jgi:CheY-like chemotaxis protein
LTRHTPSPESDPVRRHLIHEARASLNAIVGWAEVVRQGDGDQQMRERAAETILRHARLVARRLDDLVATFGLSSAEVRPVVEPPSAAPATSDKSLAGIRVLVLDDEDDARIAIERILRGHGALVAAAGAVQEALALLSGQPMDVVLADIGMPERDGLDFIRSVRGLEGPIAKTAAAAITALSSEADRRRSLDAGYQMHIVKPVEPQRLLSTVLALAGRDSRDH